MSIRKIVGHGSIYATGNIVRNMASFIMLPIYTRYLTPADYGVLELLSMVMDMAGLLLGSRISQGIYRLYFLEKDDSSRNSVISSSILLSSVLNSVAVLLVIGLSGFIAMHVFGGEEYRELIWMFAFSILLGALFEITLVYLKIQQRPWLFVGISISKLIMQLTLNIYFIVFLGMTVEGIIYSTLITVSIFSLLGVLYCFYHVGFGVRFKNIKQLIELGWPLLLASWLSFYVMYADRYFIRLFSDLSEVGIYSLAFKLAFIISFLVGVPFQHIWDSQRYEIYNDKSQHHLFGDVFTLFSILLITVGLGISLFVEELLIIMSNESFHAAAELVPYLVITVILQSLASFCNFGLFLKKKTVYIALSMLGAALVSTAGFIFVIPEFGALGAAVVIMVAFSIRLYILNYMSNKYFKMQLNWVPLFSLTAIGVVFYSASRFAPDDLIMSIAVKIMLFALFLFVLYVLPFLDDKYKNLILKIITHPRQIKAILAGKA